MNPETPRREVANGSGRGKLSFLLLAVAVPILLYGFALRLPMMGEDHFGLQALARQLYTVDGEQRVDTVIDPKVVAEYPQVVPWWTSPDAKLIFLRPLTDWYVKAEYQLWGKEIIFGYHLTSLLLFAASCLLLFQIGLLLFQRPGVAFLGMLIFCCQPYNAIVVPWMAEKASVLSLFFGLAGVTLHIRFRRESRKSLEFAAWVCFVLALLAKESGSVTLIAYFLYDCFLWRKEAPEKWPGLIRLFLYYIVLSIPLWLFVAYFALGGYGVKGFYSIFDEKGPVSGALAYMLRNALLYLYGLLFFVPGFHSVNLQLFHRPEYLLLTLGGLLLAALLFLPGIRRRFLGDRNDLFLVSWVFFALLPILQLILQNRYLYAAAAPFGLFLGSTLVRIKEANGFGRVTKPVFYGLIGFYVLLPAATVNLGMGYLTNVFDKLHGFQRQVVLETRSFLGKTDQPVNVFYLNLPNAILTFALQYNFDFQGTKGEVRAFPLAITPQPPEVTVLDDHSLRITSRSNPLLESEPERLFMTDSLNQPGLGRTNRFFQATVDRVEDGKIFAVRFEFATPLEDPSMRFFYVEGRHVVPAVFFRDDSGSLRIRPAGRPPRESPSRGTRLLKLFGLGFGEKEKP